MSSNNFTFYFFPEYNQSDEEDEDQQYEENEASIQEGSNNTLDKGTVEEVQETENNMHQEEKPEKLKQRFIVETITMTTVTERRIVREESDSNSDESQKQAIEETKKLGILKGGKFWRNSTEKGTGKSVNYTEAIVQNEGTDEIEEGAIAFAQEEVITTKNEEEMKSPEESDTKSSFELQLSEKYEEAKKQDAKDAVSPDSTELTLTFKLGQHLLVANSLKPNSAMRQLFPSPRFLSPPPLEDGDAPETNKTGPPKQFLVTAESLRLFEEAKKSKILGNMSAGDSGQSFVAIMPPILKDDDDLQNNRLQKTIERNTLRRSLVKYSYEYRNKRLSEKKKNENSLEERIRQLTCGIDDDEPEEEKKEKNENERSSPQGEEAVEQTNAMPVENKGFRNVETVSSLPNSTSNSGNSTYKKLTDLFSRKSSSTPVVEDINKNIKNEVINVQCDLVLNSENLASSCSLNSQGHRNSIGSQKNYAIRPAQNTDTKKQILSSFAPLTACVTPEDKERLVERYRLIEGGERSNLFRRDQSEYMLQDIDDGLKDFEPKKLGNQPDVIAETPQNETPNDELALFVQQDAKRIEKIKKRYSAADDKSDDDDDYGFNKRPLVRGINVNFSNTNQNPSQTSSQSQAPRFSSPTTKPITTTATSTAVHSTWPYYSQENVDPKSRSYYVAKQPNENSPYGAYVIPQDCRGYLEVGNANYVVGQQRINYMQQQGQQQNIYSATNTYYRCQPIRYPGTNYSELSNYQYRHPPHSPPPLRRIMATPQSSPMPTEDSRIRIENRIYASRNSDYGYIVGNQENSNRPKVSATEGTNNHISPPSGENTKSQDTIYHQRSVPSVHNPCVQMKFAPINYQQGAPIPTASIRFSASCSPHSVVDESNVIIEPHYSTFPRSPNQNAVGVIRVGQGQQMIRVPVPYSTGTPVQVHLMAGRLGRCDSPQRPNSPQGSVKLPIQSYNHYLVAKETQTGQGYAVVSPKPVAELTTPLPPLPSDPTKTVDFEKQGKAIAEELQSRQKMSLSRSLSQEGTYQSRVGQGNTPPVSMSIQQERGIPEGAASSSVHDSQPPNSENPTTAPAGNTIFYTMNV